MNAKIYSAHDLQSRILKLARQMACANIKKASQGKKDALVDDQLFDLMVIRKFLPFRTAAEMKEIECFLHEKYVDFN